MQTLPLALQRLSLRSIYNTLFSAARSFQQTALNRLFTALVIPTSPLRSSIRPDPFTYIAVHICTSATGNDDLCPSSHVASFNMADSCGGSTPLKALADRGSNDRSLQQDRHVRAGPSSSFRTSGPSSNGNADSMYAGFANGPGPSPVQPLVSNGLDSFDPRHTVARPILNASPVPQGFAPPNFSSRSSPAPGVSSAQSWAMDFATFNPATQAGAPLVSHVPSHHGYQLPVMPHAHIGPSAFVGNVRPAMFPAGPNSAGSYAAPTTRSAQEPQNTAIAEAEFDDAMAQWMAINGHGEDVNGILEEMAQELEEGQRAGLPELQPIRLSTAETTVSTATMDLSGQLTDSLPSHGHGSASGMLPDLNSLHLDDTTHQATQPNNTTDRAQGSEVSEAARQLLETVQHEQGEKWQKSRFLHLMREFRDGTKSIVNEEIRESGDHSTSTG
ncbi:hypothetical protein F5X68DRAFT_211689 [Plectosphaerella plurivora]|uniref:Uncharacterized protein n=1 Tax=Plectosphaerella plurivora TaxID=936078 RepID=A0A9P9A8Y9_9PEZI|nr:hypothetical protein F5X68DRAFT_211689 [Plectosphaerella plurivora]